jgi:Cof subfamily protein (haloacid dehalogenase superfamily)
MYFDVVLFDVATNLRLKQVSSYMKKENEAQFRENCRNIRLVVCDLDGTLLRNEKTLSTYTLNVLRRAREKGIFVTFCTARIPEMSQSYVKLVELNGPFIACAGAVIVDASNLQRLYTDFADKNETMDLLKFCSTRIKDYGITTDEGCWFSTKSTRIERFVQYNYAARAAGVPEIPLHYFADSSHAEAWRKNIYKIVISETEQGDCQRVKAYLKAKGRKLSFLVSESTFLDVLQADVNKGGGVRRLAGILGIPIEQTCTFGDFDSDNSMLVVAGVGVAMGNAKITTKQCAAYVTDTNEHDGVATFLEEFVL